MTESEGYQRIRTAIIAASPYKHAAMLILTTKSIRTILMVNIDILLEVSVPFFMLETC